ncbi:hypothetical protein ACHAO1_009941 [Botrytis cinerea]
MAPKRAHTKSRYGCDQCKKRRVKCDEREPTCTNCTAREIDCQYSRLLQARGTSSGPRSTSNAQSLISAGSASSLVLPASGLPAVIRADYPAIHQGALLNYRPSGPSTRQRELELMYYWFTYTCSSFTNAHADLFRGHIVQEALKHEYLMDSIFALTSLHIATQTSDAVSATSYVREALAYQNNAVPSLRAALNDVTQYNCDAVVLTSILIMACSLVSPSLSAGDKNATKPALLNIFLMYDCLHGIKSVLNTSFSWLQSGPLRDILRTPQKFQLRGNEVTILPIKILQSLNTTAIGVTNPLYETYQKAIKELERCYAEGKRIPVSWPAGLNTDFMCELEKRERMALMILMYWGVLLDRLDEMWWAKRTGKRLVEDLCRSFDGCGDEWDEAVRWAMTEVGLLEDVLVERA